MMIILFIALLAIGATSAARMSRAVGGKPIPIENASFYVSIRRANRHKCGGALLSRKHVITAQSCVLNDELGLYTGLSVVIATDLRKTDAVGRSIASVQWPSGVHGALGREMGIAILTLSDSIPLNENVAPVLFPIEDIQDDEQFESPEPLTAKLIALKSDMRSLPNEPLERLEVVVNKCQFPNQLCGRALAGAIIRVIEHSDPLPTSRFNIFESMSVRKKVPGRSGIVQGGQTDDDNDFSVGGVSNKGDKGSPLIRNERIIGIALDHRMKTRSGNTYADVHSYWDFIFKVVYNL